MYPTTTPKPKPSKKYVLLGVPKLPSGWKEYRTVTGQPYWYNTVTHTSSWVFPTQEHLPPKKHKQIKKKIPNTHWLFVLTHDGYEFYYDRETKTSVWEMPLELEEPMEQLKKMEQDKKRELEEQEQQEQEAKRVKLEQERVQLEEEQLEEAERARLEQEQEQSEEMTEEDVMWQLQEMAEAEVQKDALTEEEYTAQFYDLLQERNISPFAVYSAEYPKLMTDPRFSVVPQNKHKVLFDKYCHALGEKLKDVNKTKKKPEDQFKELLESKVTEKMYWDDFRRKYKDDPRFKAMTVTREKEALFKDHVKHHLGKNKKKEPRDEYMDLLRDTKEIRAGMRWRDAKKILEKDSRFYVIESKTEREDLFRDYLESQ
ncbi:uncharacterized protein B0P05DRAFT_546184 [Gilbertella persicaria]|uniref:uncharacterized protein n=1 Tax=Gilbertella persicaria TaxID=101096 RepID=UPI00221E5F29|nr:uncharacterized protein B0P05DRAFT_546184 [Gilbertella persicaria]KAI8076516.1 hypothetical protein B0P05DRAFT_546184 [Gilbertella persicaria]